MSRPDEIPQDVWETAQEALHVAWDEHGAEFNPLSNLISTGLWHRFYVATARAIMAERERCAKIAADEQYGLTDDDTDFGKAYGIGYQHACRNTASAIRGQS